MTNTRSPSTVTAIRPRWVLGLTSTAYFMVVLDSLVVVTALPRMQQDLHADLAVLQWTVNAYGIAFAAAFLITQEFQVARGYSPISTGLRLLPFFATPMVISPFAGAISDRIGRRPIMVSGLALQALGFTWVAARGSLRPNWVELAIALLVAGIGISMALPTVPTAILNAVPATQLGKASGINYMAQRFGAVLAIAIGSAVFTAYGHLGNPATVTAGFRPAMWSAVAFAVLAAATALAIPAPAHRTTASQSTAHTDPADIFAAA